MKIKADFVIWFGWLALIFLWNFMYPNATALMDVGVAVLLSLLSIQLNQLFKKSQN